MNQGILESRPSSPSPYLDTLCSSPHFPTPLGNLESTSKVILPNLQRTGINSKYSKSRPRIIDPLGKISDAYIQQSNIQINSMPKLYNTKKLLADTSFILPHRTHLNNHLIKLDKKREQKILETKSKISTDSKLFGFSEINSDTLCLSPNELFNRSLLLSSTMKSKAGRKKVVYSRMTLFQSMVDKKNEIQIPIDDNENNKNRYEFSSKIIHLKNKKMSEKLSNRIIAAS